VLVKLPGPTGNELFAAKVPIHPQLYVTSPTATTNTVTTGCYAGPNNSAGDPRCVAGSTFLHATGAHLGRILQLGLKVIF
jgi:hypothetical protein